MIIMLIDLISKVLLVRGKIKSEQRFLTIILFWLCSSSGPTNLEPLA